MSGTVGETDDRQRAITDVSDMIVMRQIRSAAATAVRPPSTDLGVVMKPQDAVGERLVAVAASLSPRRSMASLSVPMIWAPTSAAQSPRSHQRTPDTSLCRSRWAGTRAPLALEAPLRDDAQGKGAISPPSAMTPTFTGPR